MKPSEAEIPAVHLLPIDRILPIAQPIRRNLSREQLASLADSIRQFGVLQPLCVRRIEDTPDTYALIAGERRFRAAKMLGINAVPCIILHADSTQSAAVSILENIQRQNLTMFEVAAAYAALMRDHSMTQEEIARQLGVSQSYVANKLRLLRFTPEEQALLLDGGLSERHARALLRLHGDERLAALRRVIADGKNVAQTEAYVEQRLLERPLERPLEQSLGEDDVRRFCDSVQQALAGMRRAGFAAEAEEETDGTSTEMRIRIRPAGDVNVSRETIGVCETMMRKNVSRETFDAKTEPRETDFAQNPAKPYAYMKNT